MPGGKPVTLVMVTALSGGHEAGAGVRDLGGNGHADHGLIGLARRPGGQSFRAQGRESVCGSAIRVHFTDGEDEKTRTSLQTRRTQAIGFMP